MKNHEKKNQPLVSVLVPTYNRRRYLSVALSSLVNQDYSNLEIFVIRDGGEDISDVVNSFNDPRIVLIDRDENRGKAFSLNEAMEQAKGEYIAYLDDDDLHYPHHIETLVDALESNCDCQVAYSDLYRTYCRIGPDGRRQVLSKVVDVSRDFDRFVMLCFNHVLHVSLMHRRDLFEKVGPYNEELSVLIDWDLTRKLAFFSDFCHVHQVTGEFYSPVGESDRMSVLRRQDRNEYLRNFIKIRTTRPPKPWPKIRDLSVVFTTRSLDRQARDTLGSIWRHSFYPYEVYLPLPQSDVITLDTEMPNIITVPVDPLASEAQRIEAALARCDGDYVAVVPSGFPIRDLWIEDSLYALINSSEDFQTQKRESGSLAAGREGFELEGSTDELWAVVVRKEDLEYARKSFPSLPLRQSLEAAGIAIRRVLPEEIPFQFDQLLQEAKSAGRGGDWAKAGEMFEYITEHYENELWLKTLAAEAFFRTGQYIRAAELSSEVNKQRPTADSLLLEARISREKEEFSSAIELLERAEQILQSPVCSG